MRLAVGIITLTAGSRRSSSSIFSSATDHRSNGSTRVPNQMIFLGGESLDRAIAEYTAHYHEERSGQGIGNDLIGWSPGRGRCQPERPWRQRAGQQRKVGQRKTTCGRSWRDRRTKARSLRLHSSYTRAGSLGCPRGREIDRSPGSANLIADLRTIG